MLRTNTSLLIATSSNMLLVGAEPFSHSPPPTPPRRLASHSSRALSLPLASLSLSLSLVRFSSVSECLRAIRSGYCIAVHAIRKRGAKTAFFEPLLLNGLSDVWFTFHTGGFTKISIFSLSCPLHAKHARGRIQPAMMRLATLLLAVAALGRRVSWPAEVQVCTGRGAGLT
eukprot:1391527-Amorphochlora_amoeboformis.AAC.1